MDAQVGSRHRNAAAWWAALAYVFVFEGLYVLPLGSAQLARASVVLFLVPIGFALWTCARATGSTLGKERRMWRLLTASLGAFGVGMVFRAYHVFAFGAHPEAGSFEDAAFAVGFLALVPVVLLMTEPYEVPGLVRLRNALDLSAMVVATLSVVYLFVIVPGGGQGGDVTVLGNVLLVLYPVVSCSLVLYIVSFKRGRWMPWEITLLAGLCFAAGGMLLVSAAVPRGLYYAGAPAAAAVDGAWVAAILLFGIAALQRSLAPSRLRRQPQLAIDLPHWPGLAVLILGLVGIPVLVMVSYWIPDEGHRVVLSISVSLLAGLIMARSAVVSVENRRLAREVPTDSLTGLGNLKSFRKALTSASARARSGEHVSLAVFDIDHFDAVNAQMGYAIGDRVLRRIGEILAQTETHECSAYRVGGDDFVLLMSATDAVEAYEVSMRVLGRLARDGEDGIPGVGMSVGIASMPLHTQDVAELMRLAEGAAYHAKMAGGAQITIYDLQVVDVFDKHQHIAALERQSHTAMVESLAAAVDAKDAYTQFHSRNVAALSGLLAADIGMSAENAELLYSAALLHDVGKIGVPDTVLKKPGKLEPDEYALIRAHPDVAVDILHASVRGEILPWVHCHHEQPDGKGYPRGLRASEIPLEAKILAVCDAFDAMTSERPYRSGLSTSSAIAELRRCSGTQFDAELVERFIALVEAGKTAQLTREPDLPHTPVIAISS